jgi:hypothetical protein
MKTYYKNLFVAGLLTAAMAPAVAHHSFTMVDRDTAKLIEGKVVEWHFNSPHAWLYIEAPDADGNMIRWGVEGGAPVHIIRNGVKGDTFRLGEEVRIVMAPLRDGRPAGGVCFVEKDGGQIVMFNDGSCFAQTVLETWQQKGWLAEGKHLDMHPNEAPVGMRSNAPPVP